MTGTASLARPRRLVTSAARVTVSAPPAVTLSNSTPLEGDSYVCHDTRVSGCRRRRDAGGLEFRARRGLACGCRIARWLNSEAHSRRQAPRYGTSFERQA